MKRTFDFLIKLCINNNREWFNSNKSEYLTAKKDFDSFINDLIKSISSWDSTLKGLDAKDCVFRIYRDSRFSQDKSPYKNHFGAYIIQGGRKTAKAGHYIHIEPDNSFVAGGIYMPPSAELKNIRQAIVDNSSKYLSIINEPHFASSFEFFQHDKVKTIPRGFSKNFEHLDLIRNKHYAFSKKISDETVLKDDLIQRILDDFKLMKPYNDFINKAIS